MSFSFGTIWSQNKKNVEYRGKPKGFKKLKKSNKFMSNKLILSNKVIKKPTYNSKSNIYIKKNLPWAHATWHLFHLLPARISDNDFLIHKKIILSFITKCCSKLPCPYCKNHAQNYLRRYPVERINSREQLEEYLYNFHNNAHRVPRQIHKNMVLPQYKTMNVRDAFIKFERTFFQSFIGGRYFSDWIRNDFKTDYYKFKNIIINKLN